MNQPNIVTREAWIEARKQLLALEKAHMRRGDELAVQRRALPWVRIEKEYVFQTERGSKTLAELFSSRSQLIAYHFMFAPGWEAGCTGCSFLADHFDGANLHLAHHDVTLIAVSRAPLAEFLPYKRRMNWRFDWVSSHGSDFNYDFHVSVSEAEKAAGKRYYNYETVESSGGELFGLSVFYRDKDGAIYHTYSTYARGGDILIGAHAFLDLTPKGRNETTTMDWVRRHDEYEGERQQRAWPQLGQKEVVS
jgi:predicted dithiol-disulfide oxidoreductase (DUF899 family)